MFAAAGTIYVYLTYGVHYCLNIVTGREGAGEAVLIRAAEPESGLEIMRQNRRVENIEHLANGPGKLTQALGIKDTSLSGEILNKSSIYLEPPLVAIESSNISASARIGITKATENPWRFYIKNSRFVSRSKIRL